MDTLLHDPKDKFVLLSLDSLVVTQATKKALEEQEVSSMAMVVQATKNHADAAKVQPYLGFSPLETIRRTLENTTQMAATVGFESDVKKTLQT